MRWGICALLLLTTVALPMAQPPPLTVVVLLDVTASVSEAMATARAVDPYDKPGADITGARETLPKPEIIKQPNAPSDLFLGPLLKALIPGLGTSDRARIGSVSRILRLSSEFSRKPDALERAVREALDVPDADRYGPTPLWDAIDSAVSTLDDESGRRAIVIVTDGLATGNRLGFEAVLAHAIRANVSVSVVCEWWGIPRTAQVGKAFHVTSATNWPWKLMSPFNEPPDLKMEKLSRATGGLFVPDGEGNEDPNVAAALIQVLGFLHGVGPRVEEKR